MSYAQGIEVIMSPVLPSAAALATHYGPDVALSVTTDVAKWAPGYFNYQLKAVSVVMTSLPAAMGAVTPISFFHKRPWTGTNGATVAAQVNLPVSLSLSGTGPVACLKRVTSNVEVRVGEAIVCQPTTAATAQVRGLCVLYVVPNYESPTIGRTASTASTAGNGPIFILST